MFCPIDCMWDFLPSVKGNCLKYIPQKGFLSLTTASLARILSMKRVPELSSSSSVWYNGSHLVSGSGLVNFLTYTKICPSVSVLPMFI